MKLSAAASTMLVVAVSVGSAAAAAAPDAEGPAKSLRGLAAGDNGNKNGRPLTKKCTVIATADLRIPGAAAGRNLLSGSDTDGADETFLCEIDPLDHVDGIAGQSYPLVVDASQDQLLHDMLYSGELISGEDAFFDSEATIGSDGKIFIPPGLEIRDKLDTSGRSCENGGNGMSANCRGRGRKLSIPQTGSKPILVVKVIDVNGLARSETPTTISDDVFGTYGDPVNLKSQMYDCSFQQLNIMPGDAGANEAASGVIEVTIPISLQTATDRYEIHNAVTAAVNAKLGISLPGPYEQVMYVLEACYVSCGWAAYAYINSWMSVYQSGYYKTVGVQMHEIGHNFGFAHSGGLNGATYTDHTGLMGNPLYSDDVGKMCWNAAKSWQCGWYDTNKITVDPRAAPWTGTIIGIANFDAAGNHPVVIRIDTGTSTDQFVAFNRATGVNSQNDEADDEVTVVETGNNGEGYSQSYLKAHLVQDESYTYPNWAGTGEDLVITANVIDLSTNPGYAEVSIVLGGLGGCTSDADCTDAGAPVCDTTAEQCVQCLADADCGSEYCISNQCVACRFDADCNTNSDNACINPETCSNGVCQTGSEVPCDNGLYCDGIETCDVVLGCQPGTAPTCPNGCDEATDSCFECSVETVASDCGVDDACNQYSCISGTCFNDPVNCDDGDDCTLDSCDAANGGCVNTFFCAACSTLSKNGCNDAGSRCTWVGKGNNGNCEDSNPNPTPSPPPPGPTTCANSGEPCANMACCAGLTCSSGKPSSRMCS